MQEKDKEMFVAGLVLDPASNAPIVILKNSEGNSCLPIWIGLAEATAIASALKNVNLARPMTHDLMANILDEFEARVVQIRIRGLEDNTFLADIELALGEASKVIDARPSDAIALAVRVNAPIMVAASVLDKAQVQLVISDDSEVEGVPVSRVESTDFISENFANIDEQKWAEILDDMEPDDFKYKM